MNQRLKTGIIYDQKLLLHCSVRGHPESPARLLSIIDLIQKKYEGKNQNIQIITELSPISNELLTLVHDEAYILTSENIYPDFVEFANKDLWMIDSYINKHSDLCAKIAAQGVIEAIQNIQEGIWQNAYVAIRPPGHHTGHVSHYNGYCIFNNVAIGVKYARKKYGLQKIAIIDWDVHHGDGTQSVFYQDSDTLFISLHRYDQVIELGHYYPGISGSMNNIGEGSGKYYNINIPWDVDRTNPPNTSSYLYAFDSLICPVLKEFNPDMIFVSCGFDAGKGDPLGGCEVDKIGFALMTSKLMKIQEKIVLVLEGGYNLKVLEWGSLAVIQALIEDFSFQEVLVEPHSTYKEKVDEIKQIMKQKWTLQ